MHHSKVLVLSVLAIIACMVGAVFAECPSEKVVVISTRGILCEKTKELKQVGDGIKEVTILQDTVSHFYPEQSKTAPYLSMTKERLDSLVQIEKVLKLEVDSLTIRCNLYDGDMCDQEKKKKVAAIKVEESEHLLYIAQEAPIIIVPTCFGIKASESSVCSSNGQCSSENKCICKSGFEGEKCERKSISCFGIPQQNATVCSSHGECHSQDSCICKSGFEGVKCENITITCSGISSKDSKVCSSRGTCKSNDNCICNSGFFGKNCEGKDILCYGVNSNIPTVCSSQGKCISEDKCSCNNGFTGIKCEQKISMTFRVKLFLDGTDTLTIKGGKMTWKHLTHQLPTQITVSGTKWNYKDTYSLPYNTDGVNMSMKKISGRGRLVVSTKPSAANNWTSVITFDDSVTNNQAWYEAEITFAN